MGKGKTFWTKNNPKYIGKVVSETPKADMSNTLNVNSSNTVESQFSIAPGEEYALEKTVNGEVTSGRTITFDDVEGIVDGATISGTNVGSGRTVASISGNVVTMTGDVTGTVADNATITFGGGLGSNVSVLHESVTKVGSNIVIEVLMDVLELEDSFTPTINIDNLITVS